MSTVLLAGVGEVGAARGPTAPRHARRRPGVGGCASWRTRARPLALDDGAESVELKQGTALPNGIDAIACAVPRTAEAWIINAAIEQGIAVAAVTEDADALAARRH